MSQAPSHATPADAAARLLPLHPVRQATDIDRERENNDVQTILIVDDDPMVSEAVAGGLAQDGRRIIICRDIESARVVVETEEITAVINDIRFHGDFSFEGLDFLDFLRIEKPTVPMILMTGAATDGLEREALRRGAHGFLRKPFAIEELEVLLRETTRGLDSLQSVVRVPDLDEILADDLLSVQFQPIVSLPDHQPVGFEALARIRTDSLFRNPELLFRYASRASRTIELEKVCLAGAILASADLISQGQLFLNVHPNSLENPDLVEHLVTAAGESNVPMDRIVLEITEQGAIRSRAGLLQVRALKELGVHFALDDIGVAFSHLPYIDEIRPAWMKISQLFGTDFEKEPTKVKIVKNLANLAESFNSSLILEGIETAETAAEAAAIGIGFGQGYHFARPASADTFKALAGPLPFPIDRAAHGPELIVRRS
jgi:EAL domain-containing protein (putative c-di-GMP-specific phosphodiesterase class I)/ActR/RegA family two-component response regulator